MIKSKFLKAMLGLALVVVTSAGYVSTASAKLSGQVSQGKGIKCYFVSTTQPDGTIVHTQVCRKVGV
jgi:outer membrane lipoprotein-sorting protein